MARILLLFFTAFLLNQGKALSQGHLRPFADSGSSPFRLQVLPLNFYNQHLSFFCKKELQLQKLTSLPIYIRAGSKDYVDFLERKPNAVWRPQ
jgi:hypothetical protein